MRDSSGSRTTGGRIRSHIGMSRDILRKGHSTGFDKLRVSLNVCYIPVSPLQSTLTVLLMLPLRVFRNALRCPCTITCSARSRVETPKHSY